MEWLISVVAVLVVMFGFVVFFGAPYLPTLSPQVKTALELVELKKGQHLLELGCGDGKVLIAAAEQGLQVTGYELNPLLALIAWVRTWRYKKQVKVIWGNFWKAKLPVADGIFVFLLPKYMEKLNNKIVQDMKSWSSDIVSESNGKKINPTSVAGGRVKLVSFAFEIKSKKPSKVQDGVFLYKYE